MYRKFQLVQIIPIADAEPATVEALLDSAFGADRHQRTAYRLRAGTRAIPELSFAALDAGALVGTIQCWPIQLMNDDGSTEALIMVGPVAVTPQRQRGGIGVALMNRTLTEADLQGDDALMLIGDPEYYDRLFGFNAEHTGGWDVPGPVERHRLLARLKGPRLHGKRGLLTPRPVSAGIVATA